MSAFKYWLAVVLLVACGAVGVAVGNPFSGRFGSAGGATDTTPCGVTDPCAADSYEATTETGPAFTCNSQLSNCVDLGPGTNNEIGTNVSGHVVIGSGGSGVFKVGDNFTAAGNGSLSVGNGAINANGSTILRNETGGTALTIDETDGTRMVPQASTPSCAAGNVGTWSTLSGDSRARYCDGTTAQIVGFVLTRTANINFASMNSQGTDSQAMTITGAATSDAVFCTPVNGGTMQGTDMHPTVTAADTVTIVAHNDTGGTIDPSAMDIKCVIVR